MEKVIIESEDDPRFCQRWSASVGHTAQGKKVVVSLARKGQDKGIAIMPLGSANAREMALRLCRLADEVDKAAAEAQGKEGF